MENKTAASSLPPAQVDAHRTAPRAGKIVTAPRLPEMAMTVTEKAYIPVTLAKQTIDRMESDMKAMKERHMKMISEIGGHYSQVEEETKNYFVAFVSNIQARAKEEISNLKQRLHTSHTELKALKADSSRQINELQATVSRLEGNLLGDVTRMQTDMEQARQQHSDALEAMKTANASQVAALKEKIVSLKAKHKKQTTEMRTKFRGFITAREEVIGTLEFDRKKLVAAVLELHASASQKDAHIQQLTAVAAAITAATQSGAPVDAAVLAVQNAQVAALQAQLAAVNKQNEEMQAQLVASAGAGAAVKGSVVALPLAVVSPVKAPPPEADTLLAVLTAATEVVKQGESLWVDKKKRQALKLYQTSVAEFLTQLPASHPMHPLLQAASEECAAQLDANAPAKAAFVLKQSIDQLIATLRSDLGIAAPPDSLSSEAVPQPADEPRPVSASSVAVGMEPAQLNTATGVQESNGEAAAAQQQQAVAGSDYNSLLIQAALQRAANAEGKLSQLQAQMQQLRDELEALRVAKSDSGIGGEGDEANDEAMAEEAAAAEEEEAQALQQQLEAEEAKQESESKEGKEGKGPADGKAGAAAGGRTPASGAAAPANPKDANKLKEQDKLIKDLRTKVRTLETAAKAAASKPGAVATAGAVDEKAMNAALEKRTQMLEKKWKKEKEDIEKDNKRELDSVNKKLAKATADLTDAQAAAAALTSERDDLKKKLAALGDINKEVEALRAVAEEAKKLKVDLDLATKHVTELDKLYKDEQILRKRYYNMMEDMKGKIRVYARCRPMSNSEIERGNYSVITFPDEVTIELDTGKTGKKQFIYDQCFGANSTQEQVFQDTENLIQSAFDGFNVAIFAYGQTGSGKTFTMVGSPTMPGLTPRAVSRVFALADKNKGVYEVTVQAYMVELYLDNLIDLFWRIDNARDRGDGPKLDIKKDDKGLVVIKGVAIRDCPTAESVMELFDSGNSVRHVGSTAMNATSSRSHLIFALLINTYNKQTKKTTTGKLSLIDLAGSERVGKTGATADRLKEAQSINKSLSALGNVISALSTNEKFIPYRDNKLTQLMSDSLGGNAKTLMFVNLSPADYNTDETQTSLVYASRVKLITNNAEKQQESAEVAKLKKIIKQLKTGGLAAVVDLDLDLEEDAAAAGAAAAASPTPEAEPDYSDGPITDIPADE